MNCGLGGGERAEELPLGLPGRLGGLLDDAVPALGQRDDVLAPVLGVLAPVDEPLDLKVVDQRDHRRAVDVQRAGDFALGDRTARVDDPEHGGLPPVDPEGRKRDRAELEEPQLRVLEQVSQVCVLPSAGHAAKCTNKLIISHTDYQL